MDTINRIAFYLLLPLIGVVYFIDNIFRKKKAHSYTDWDGDYDEDDIELILMIEGFVPVVPKEKVKK